MMLVAAGLMTGCGKDSEETPTKPEDCLLYTSPSPRD